MNDRRWMMVGASAMALASGCGGRNAPSVESAAVALPADLRMVGGESTWVTRGPGYELVGHSKRDLAAIVPRIDREGAVFRRVFPEDSAIRVVATVRKMPLPGQAFIPAPPLPPDAPGGVVDLVLFDPAAMKDRKDHEGPRAGMPGVGEMDPTRAMTRAWLAAHASKVTGKAATSPERRGETADPRVSAWAYEMLPALAADELVDPFTTSLASHEESIIPLDKYFTMEAPAFAPPGAASGAEGRGAGGGRSSGGMGGGRGGMGGGRGGMRGGRGGGGGTPGGESSGSRAGAMPMQGEALFHAQSVVLGRYLGRDGASLIGTLIDAQLTDKPLDDVLHDHSMGSVAQVDSDWRKWLAERSAALARY